MSSALIGSSSAAAAASLKRSDDSPWKLRDQSSDVSDWSRSSGLSERPSSRSRIGVEGLAAAELRAVVGGAEAEAVLLRVGGAVLVVVVVVRGVVEVVLVLAARKTRLGAVVLLEVLLLLRAVVAYACQLTGGRGRRGALRQRRKHAQVCLVCTALIVLIRVRGGIGGEENRNWST